MFSGWHDVSLPGTIFLKK